MRIDVERTARAREAAGVAIDWLDRVWHVGAAVRGIPKGGGDPSRLRPYCRKPGVPPTRDAYGKARHLRRKRARAARRRNRR